MTKTVQVRRRGALRPHEVPPEIVEALSLGIIETSNFSEQVALDQRTLLASVVPQAAHRSADLEAVRLIDRMWAGAGLVLSVLGDRVVTAGRDWISDTARAWAAMAVSLMPGLSLKERLELLQPYVDDDHFAVREWVWIGFRPHILPNPSQGISALVPWTYADQERRRRFASESTRPIGVWAPHIPELKQRPALGLPLLSQLNCDPSRYVQLSVGNWLNDAAKTNPGWVRKVCENWLQNGSSAATLAICKRGMRSIRNQTEV